MTVQATDDGGKILRTGQIPIGYSTPGFPQDLPVDFFSFVTAHVEINDDEVLFITEYEVPFRSEDEISENGFIKLIRFIMKITLDNSPIHATLELLRFFKL